jgi:quercetin dioxygenase-like cupin family protein
MRRGFSSLTVLLSLLMSTALAQDFAKVAPNNVKVEIDNHDVRILRVHYGPHDKTAMHGHPDHVIVFLTDNHTKHTFADGTTKELQSKAGQVVWRPALKHAVENLSDQPFDVIEIELKGKATAYAATTKPGSGQ